MDKMATVKKDPIEEQLGVNAIVGVRIGATIGAGDGAIQNAPRTLMDYAQPSLLGIESCITRPTIQSNNFELKPSFVTMI